MKIAHLSDMHVLSLDGVSPFRFLNKRLTGYANLRLKRKHVHHPLYVRVIANEIRRLAVDHVVVTGDFTNLSLDEEFTMARELLELELGLTADKITLVPGNHDVYTRGAYRERRFLKHFARYQVNDLPELAVDTGFGRYPVVQLREKVAIISLTSAVPRAPFVAAGRIGEAQIAALTQVLLHKEVRERTPIIVMHHPAHNPTSWLGTKLRGLDDAGALLAALAGVARGVLLHGHLHTRVHVKHETSLGTIDSYGATSASLEHEGAHQMAGFNVYRIDADGELEDAAAHVYDKREKAFRVERIPQRT